MIFPFNVFFWDKCSLVQSVEQGPEQGARSDLCACHCSLLSRAHTAHAMPAAPTSVHAPASEVSEAERSTRCVGATDILEQRWFHSNQSLHWMEKEGSAVLGNLKAQTVLSYHFLLTWLHCLSQTLMLEMRTWKERKREDNLQFFFPFSPSFS